MPVMYPEDRTGSLVSNKIVDEVQTITAENSRDFHFFVPKFAPFYEGGFTIFQDINDTLLPLVEGVDYYLCYRYESASLSTAKNVFAGVAFTNLATAGVFKVSYQTVGGDWTLDNQQILEIVANEVYNPRGRTWDQVNGKPTNFGPTSHIHNASDFLSEAEVGVKLDDIAQAIRDNINRPINTAPVTLADLGIPRIGNWGMASVDEAVEGVAADSIISPLTLNAVLYRLGLLDLSADMLNFRSHITNYDNPHRDDKETVGLNKVENVGLAPEERLIADQDDEGLISLTQLRKYLKIHGCAVAPEEKPKYAEKDSLLSYRCTSNYDRIGIFADGTGHTYEKVIETKSTNCGYVPPIKNNYPPHGTVLQYYCLEFDRWKIVADGYGGSYHSFVEANSTNCGFDGGPTTTHPPAGTLLSAYCDKTVLVQTLANGSGGSYENRIAGHATCTDNTSHPPRGTLVTTYCENKNEIGKYTDGAGGYYTEVLVLNATKCGGGETTTTTTSTHKPYGTPLGSACIAPATKVNKFADGAGGFYTEVVQYNSPECGFIHTSTTTTTHPPYTTTSTPGSNMNVTYRTSTTYITPSSGIVQHTFTISAGPPNTSLTLTYEQRNAQGADVGTYVAGSVTTDFYGNATITRNANPQVTADRLPNGTYSCRVHARGGILNVASNTVVLTYAGFDLQTFFTYRITNTYITPNGQAVHSISAAGGKPNVTYRLQHMARNNGTGVTVADWAGNATTDSLGNGYVEVPVTYGAGTPNGNFTNWVVATYGADTHNSSEVNITFAGF